jgi:hypothetical protein
MVDFFGKGEIMEQILAKISRYDIFTNLLSGTVFAVYFQNIGDIPLHTDNQIMSLFLYYFIGVIISRFGSIVIENFLIFIKLIKYKEYSAFIKACDKDKKIETLLESNNMYRSLSSLMAVIGLTKLYEFGLKNLPFLPKANPFIVGVLLFVLFLFSFRKQTNYICDRIEDRLKEDNNCRKKEQCI